MCRFDRSATAAIVPNQSGNVHAATAEPTSLGDVAHLN